MTQPMVQVFVSSTWLDLQPERAAVETALQRLREAKFIGMEYFGSRDESTRRASLEEVDRSQVYLGLFAGRYGSGITEDEYRRARRRDLPCFIYFKADPTIPAQWRETEPAQAKKLTALKAELRRQHTISEFRNPDELAAKVTADLHRWLVEEFLEPKLAQAARGEVPRADTERLLAAIKDLSALNQQLVAKLRNKGFIIHQTGSGAIAIGKGAVAAGAGGVAIGGNVSESTVVTTGDGNTILKAEQMQLIVDPALVSEILRALKPATNLEPALTKYLQYVLDRYCYLDFKGLGVADRVPLKLELLDLFVPLKARIEMPSGETWDRQLQLAGRHLAEEDRAALGERLSEPVPLLDLLQKHHGLVILGDPGAGKTTFLKYVALLHAKGRCAEKRLPVLVPLSAYANALAERDTLRLDEFIASYLRERGSDLPLDALLHQALDEGRALVMLDGLDEVTDLNLRQTLVRRVEDFYSFHRGHEQTAGQGNKFLITSRIVGYREVRPSAGGLEECTLVDFDQTEIETFVGKWTAALEKAASGDNAVARQDAERERHELLEAVGNNPGVRRLAANPLLLTVLALMKRQGVTLPERRVELYQKYVETLLSSWNRARGLGRAPTRDLDLVETVKVLAPLALWMHTVNPGVGLVKKVELEDQLQRLYTERGEAHPESAVRQFLRDVHDHTCLLLERGPGLYGLIHLTFEEYFAAVALAQQGQESVEPVVRQILGRVGEPAWREVIVLAIGYLGIVQQRDQAASRVVEGMLRGAARTHGLSVVVAGQAVADACPSGVTPACRAATVQALLGTMADHDGTPPTTRAEAGHALARLGDPRVEVVPKKLEDLGAMEFCFMPPGPFLMGEEGRENKSLTQGYWMGRYPVTTAQFAWFVRDGGYSRAGFWQEAIQAQCWKDGKFKPRYEEDWGTGPRDCGFPFDQPNHPVVGVSWFEALAFCHWLEERWRAQLPRGWRIALPSEVEWEKAARGGKELPAQNPFRKLADLALPEPVEVRDNPMPKRKYPWGEEFDPNLANCDPTEIKATSAAGCFSAGASPYGVEELSGNVWEWCRDEEGGARGLRGGAFNFDSSVVRCAFRFGSHPDFRYRGFGFRVVASPFVSGI